MTTDNKNLLQQIKQVCQQAKLAAQTLATTSTADKNAALQDMSQQLLKQKEVILAINQQDIIQAEKNN